MRRHRSLAASAAALVLAFAAPALAQSTANLQGNDAASWMADAHIHAFYDLSKQTLGHGPAAPAQVDAYEQKSFAIFREFGASRGMSPAAMQDHLKLIPRQVVQIVKDDPHALDSYRTFTDAMFGPP